MKPSHADLHDKSIIFDTNRSWCGLISAVAALFPEAKILCTVRSLAWILDSVEQHVQRNGTQPPKIFSYEPSTSVYSRVEMLMKTGFVGTSFNALRQAWFGEHAARLIAIRYESLAAAPAEVIGSLYELLEQPRFTHDFENVQYDEPEFDEVLGLPGFHKVAPRVEWRKRQTILPPDIFAQYNRAFWETPGQNPHNVTIL